jgi:hypothetical protein
MATTGDQTNDRTERRLRRSPLDPYVERVAQWIASFPDGVSSAGLSAAIAREMEWPSPFADAILTSVKARRILRVQRAGARSLRLGLSPRGEAWLEDQAKQHEGEG